MCLLLRLASGLVLRSRDERREVPWATRMHSPW